VILFFVDPVRMDEFVPGELAQDDYFIRLMQAEFFDDSSQEHRKEKSQRFSCRTA